MARRPKPVHQMTAAQFDELFRTEADCIRYLVVRRWPEGVACPRCGNPKVTALESGLSLAVLPVRARDELSLLSLDRHNL